MNLSPGLQSRRSNLRCKRNPPFLKAEFEYANPQCRASNDCILNVLGNVQIHRVSVRGAVFKAKHGTTLQ